MTRAGELAVAALARIVRRHGFADGVLNALLNVHHVGVVPIAAKALTDDDPAVRADAVGAMLAGLESAPKQLRSPRRRALVDGVFAALADPRTWREGDDPWVTLFAWGTEVLEKLRARKLLPFIRRCRRDHAHREHHEDLVRLERRLQRRARTRAR